MSHSTPPVLTRDRMLALSIPLAALAVAAWCSWAAVALRLSTAELILLSASALLSLSIALWYIAGAFYLAFFYLKPRSILSAQEIPRWVPRLMRNLAIGTLGVSLYASPAVATENPQPSTVQSIKIDEGFSANSLTNFYESATDLTNTQKHSLSSFFSSSHASEQTVVPPTSVEQEKSSLVYQEATSRSESVNPFFTTTPRENLNRDTSTHLHVVLQGQSLWTIAQQYLPEDTTDAEIMEFVAEIYDINSFQVPFNENLIHPGQQLLIPVQ